MLCSLQGFLVVISYLLQYSVFFFFAFIAFTDVHIAERINFAPSGRRLFFGLSIAFVVVTVCNMCRSVYRSAQDLSDRAENKLIIDVINDLHPK